MAPKKGIVDSLFGGLIGQLFEGLFGQFRDAKSGNAKLGPGGSVI